MANLAASKTEAKIMTVTREVALPEVVVDRSPELKRRAKEHFMPGGGIGAMTAVLLTAEGTRGDGSACPVARLILAHCPAVEKVHIEGEQPYLILKGGMRINLNLGKNVAEWIGKFDRGEPVEPMWVDLG